MQPFATPQQLEAMTKGAIPASHPSAEDLLNGASRAIRRRCGWHIGPEVTEVLTVDGSGGELLQLPTMHLRDVVSVAERGRGDVRGDLVEWSQTGTLRAPRGRWTDRFRGVRAHVTHGYALEDLADLTQIVLQVTAIALSSPTGATREQSAALAVSWATTAPGVSGGLALLQRDLDIVDSYRIGASA